jgi:lipooligosaccharide transport system permease protein
MSAVDATSTAPAVDRPEVRSWRAVLLVMEHFWKWYRRNWRATIVGSVVEPLLFLLAFGLGFGALVNSGGRLTALTGGLPYLVWLAPALLAMNCVQIAAFEASYPVVSGFKWQRVYWAITATPVTPGQVGTGYLCWIAVRMLSSGAVYVSIIALFGGVRDVGIVASLLAATLCGTAFAAPVMAFATVVRKEGPAFGALFRFLVIPMTLFSGTFFPLEGLPEWVRPFAWVTPLWHGTELARGAALGSLQLSPALGHLAYLIGLLSVGVVLMRWRFRARLFR